jgi:hypothetical protein
MISKLLYFGYLTLAMVNQNNIPDRCSIIEDNQYHIHEATRLTGYRDSNVDEYLQLLEKKSDILDCKKKLQDHNDPKYLRRETLYEQVQGCYGYLTIMHCPELHKGLQSFENHHEHLTTIDAKLYQNMQDQHKRLQCDLLHQHHNEKHPHHHTNQTEGN